MSKQIKWVAVHTHSNGTDAMVFTAPDDLYEQVPGLAEEEIQRAFTEEFLPLIDFEPDQGETLEICSLNDSGYSVLPDSLSRFAATVTTV